MSNAAAGLLLCCCGDRPLCGACPASYVLSWTGSIELLALCCPVVICTEPDVAAGEFSTLCDPCTLINNYGGAFCNGDCPKHGCRTVVYNAAAGPFALTLTAPQAGTPCIYTGTLVEEIGEIHFCCPPDPATPYCGSGQWGIIKMIATAVMERGAFGVPDQDWRLVLTIQIVFEDISGLVADSTSQAIFCRAPASGDACPHTVGFVIEAQDLPAGSGLSPCNISKALPFPTINVHASDAGTISVQLA